jgi:hypothetical protein
MLPALRFGERFEIQRISSVDDDLPDLVFDGVEIEQCNRHVFFQVNRRLLTNPAEWSRARFDFYSNQGDIEEALLSVLTSDAEFRAERATPAIPSPYGASPSRPRGLNSTPLHRRNRYIHGHRQAAMRFDDRGVDHSPRASRGTSRFCHSIRVFWKRPSFRTTGWSKRSILLSGAPREPYPSPFTGAAGTSGGGQMICSFSLSARGTKGLLSEEVLDANSETLLKEIGSTGLSRLGKDGTRPGDTPVSPDDNRATNLPPSQTSMSCLSLSPLAALRAAASSA